MASGIPLKAPPHVVQAAQERANAAWFAQEEAARVPEHRCGNCYVPGFGRSAIRCPNDDTPLPAPPIDFEAEHDPACRGCIERFFVNTRRAEFDERAAA